MTDKQLFEIIKQNIKEYYYDQKGNPEELLSKIRTDGSFSDLDYEKQDWTVWGPHIHTSRIKKLSQMYADSLLISADNGHALHPNHPEKSDSGNYRCSRGSLRVASVWG